MNDLIKIEETKTCPSFSKAEIEIVNNSNTKRILNLNEEEIILSLTESISNAIIVVGNKSLNSDDVSIIIQQISSYLKENHQYEKIGEIKQAIKLGSFGKFKKEKDILYISPANIVKWINDYKEETRETLSKQNKFELEVIEKEKEKIDFMEAAEKYWIDLPKNIDRCRYITKSPMASKYFENLWKLGLIALDAQEIKILKEKAEEEVRGDLRAKRKNILKIGVENLSNMANSRAKEKAFYLWIEENKDNDIEEIVKGAIDNMR